MQKVLLSKQAGILTIALLMACPLLNSRTDAMSVRQAVMKTQSTAADPGTKSSRAKTAVLVRNTAHEVTAKADRTDTAPGVKLERVKDKKTAGRCWKRLMSNLRDIRKAQKKD